MIGLDHCIYMIVIGLKKSPSMYRDAKLHKTMDDISMIILNFYFKYLEYCYQFLKKNFNHRLLMIEILFKKLTTMLTT